MLFLSSCSSNVLASFSCCCGLGVKSSSSRPKIRNGCALSKEAVSLCKRKKATCFEEKYKDWSKSCRSPVSLQEQSYCRCTEISPAFLLCFQTNRYRETDRESRSTLCWSKGAIRHREWMWKEQPVLWTGCKIDRGHSVCQKSPVSIAADKQFTIGRLIRADSSC